LRTCSASAATPSRPAARASSHARACAAARRSGCEWIWIDALAMVAP